MDVIKNGSAVSRSREITRLSRALRDDERGFSRSPAIRTSSPSLRVTLLLIRDFSMAEHAAISPTARWPPRLSRKSRDLRAAILMRRLPPPFSLCLHPLRADPGDPAGAHARHSARSSSRFIDCHARVSIINHLHCNRTASAIGHRGARPILGRITHANRQVASIRDAMVTMGMCRVPKCCHLSYPRARALTGTTGARRTTLRRRIGARCTSRIALHHALHRRCASGHWENASLE